MLFGSHISTKPIDMKSLAFAGLFIYLMLVAANVEKTTFIAPEVLTVPQDAAIDNLLLQSLNPDNFSVKTYLNASFPTPEQPKGLETWALLEGLIPGRRYELRVCWLATVHLSSPRFCAHMTDQCSNQQLSGYTRTPYLKSSKLLNSSQASVPTRLQGMTGSLRWKLNISNQVASS